MSWLVQVQHQNYGPYTDEQMLAYVQEGRINANSLIANDLETGFFTAGAYDIFKFWSGQHQIAVGDSSTQPYHSSQANPSTPTTQAPLIAPQSVTPAPEPQPQSGLPSVFLVMAEINSEGTMAFLHALQRFGKAERISDTLWLLKSKASVEQLRNSLSQTLNRQDRLFLLDSRENKPAWFNIGADLDHRIRDLWEDEEV